MSDNERVVVDETTGMRMEEVEPGSADDPLMTDEARAAQAAATPGAAPAPAAPAAPEGEGEQAPQPAPAPAAPTPTAPEAAPSPALAAPPAEAPLSEDEEGALGRLDDYLSEQRAEILREANANADRTISKLTERYKGRETELTERVRALEMHGLSDEEKAALKERYDLEDEKAEVKAYHDTVDAQLQDVMVARLSFEYGPFGVKEGDLQSKSVEEMELYCAQRKADYFEKQATSGGVKPAAPAAPAAPAEPPKGEAPASPAPAGASAPSDTGASTPTPTEPEFDKSMGREAMRKNLENLPVETIEPGKRA